MIKQQRQKSIVFHVVCCSALSISLSLVGACAQGGNNYSYGYYSGKNSSFTAPTEKKASEAERETAPITRNSDYHTVNKGETLYSIAWEYGQDVREVARWNQLGPPYTIYPQQSLRITPPGSSTSAGTANKSDAKPTSNANLTPAKPASNTVATTNTRVSENTKISWQWPTNGTIIGNYSANDQGKKGLDIAGRLRQPVYAASEGRVVYSGDGLRGYGKLVIIKHDETYYSAYAHNDRIHVKDEQTVKKGQHIADMGSSGTDKVKLHFEVRRDGKPVDPLQYLPKRR